MTLPFLALNTGFLVSSDTPDRNASHPVIPIVPVPALSGKGDDEVMVSLYAARQKIYPRSVSGVFSNWRWITVWITQIVFYGLPWLQWNARQAVLFDLEARRFYIFSLVAFVGCIRWLEKQPSERPG